MGMEFYSENQRKANKDYFCACCGRKIKAGEQYFKEIGKYDGEFFSRAMHIQCHMMEVEYCTEVDCEFGWDEIYDYFCDEYCDRCESNENSKYPCEYSVYKCPKIFEALKNN